MKVIDLLNKIANGEEVPKKIMFLCDVYELSMINEFTYYKNGTTPLLVSMNDLNDEVEVIEEDKKIEKLEYWVDVKSLVKDNDLEKGLEEQSKFNKNIYYKINEIIDYLKEK